MAKRKILSLNFQFPGYEDEYVSFRSDRSLLDADLIIVTPSITAEYSLIERYQGRPLLNESDSFKVVENIAHWRSELQIALDEGKTVLVFLTRLETFFVYTGSKDHSGTGRSRVTTNHVRPVENYSLLPAKIGSIVSRSGKEIRVSKDLGPLSDYWKSFAQLSAYEVYLESEFEHTLLTTKTGNKTIGAIIPVGKGSLVLLPPLDYDIDTFIEYDEETDEEDWNQEGINFGKRLVAALVGVDDALREDKQATPPPNWVQDPNFKLENEKLLEKHVTETTEQIEDLKVSRSRLSTELEEEGSLRGLLFEKGHILETAILESLRLMGFEVEQYEDSESEFDAVFASSEGRFVGEAEGRDNKAINVDKLSQLERVLQEDFARDEIDEYAKGVLFGNAYRLSNPSERGDFFTKKCLSGAKRSAVALVRTTDLFTVAKYLKENKDAGFAKSCRESIMQTEGKIVEFPMTPTKSKRKLRS